MSGSFACRAGRVRPRIGFVGLGVGLLALAPLAVAFALVTGVYPLATLVVHALVFGGMALTRGLGSTPGKGFVEGALAVGDDAITLDGELVARRGELSQGFVMPTDSGVLVRLERRAGLPIVLRVPSEDDGRAMLRALGFDAAHVAAEMRIATGLAAMPVARQLAVMLPPILAATAGMVAGAATRTPAGMAVFMTLFALLMTYALGLAFLPMRVRVGTDGLVIRWLGRPRFLPFAEVTTVEIYETAVGGKVQRGVRVTLRSGERVRLPTGQTDLGASEAARLAERIEEARKAGAEGASRSVVELGRASRSASEWVRDLRRLGAGAHDLRSAAVPVDAFLRVLADGERSAVERASAAVAVLSADRADARERVRVAANVSVSPKLRVALDRIVDAAEDEAALAEALEGLEAEEPRPRRSP